MDFNTNNQDNREIRYDPMTGEPIVKQEQTDAAQAEPSAAPEHTAEPAADTAAPTEHADVSGQVDGTPTDATYSSEAANAAHTVERPLEADTAGENTFGKSENSYRYQYSSGNTGSAGNAGVDAGNAYPHGGASSGVPPYTPPHSKKPAVHKKPKEKKFVTRGGAAALVAVCLVLSFACAALGSMVGPVLRERYLDTDQSTATKTGTDADSTVAKQPELSDDSKLTLAKDEESDGDALSVAQITEKVGDSVVEIVTEYVTQGFRASYTSEGAGSGVILTADGYIVTNNHVIADANNIHVRLRSGDYYEAKLVGTDSVTDIAVIKIDAENMTFATLGDSSQLVVGERCVAIGNPLGTLGGTVTDGIISAKDREITVEGETMVLLQTNAAVNPGNSGGGLFNMKGELIGIVNAKSSGTNVEGLGFAIPVNTAIPIIDDLMQLGYVHGRFSLGVNLVTIDTYQELLYYGVETYGVYVYEVVENSNASDAGLKRGDLILQADGKDIETSQDLRDLLDEKNAGDMLKLQIDRDGKEMTVEVTLKETTPQDTEQQ